MKMIASGLENRTPWENAGVKLLGFEWQNMRDATAKNPTWVHFGPGAVRATLEELV